MNQQPVTSQVPLSKSMAMFGRCCECAACTGCVLHPDLLFGALVAIVPCCECAAVKSMGYLWDTNGISMVFIWDIYGVENRMHNLD